MNNLNLTHYKCRSFVNHRACVWDLQFLPSPETANGNASGTGSGDSQDGSSTSSRRKKNVFPAGTFVTCSADNTVRLAERSRSHSALHYLAYST